MAVRYMSVLQADGKITIPMGICHREEFMLKKGICLKQSLDKNSIVLYKPSSELAEAIALDNDCIITLDETYRQQLNMKENEPLYFSVTGDLIVIQKASCEKCGATESIVEYTPCHFRCTECIANTIHWENEHRK